MKNLAQTFFRWFSWDYPEPRTLGDGPDGEDGKKGNVFKVTLSHF
ncbi:hypothetical protein N0B40_18460 [Chryseobacterium oranimense]|nr:hypothetical protein [Chryseobacterium oranimense]UWX60369.1 hypothetical protein N0B40_18460 [Chryseobacterium oranimense]